MEDINFRQKLKEKMAEKNNISIALLARKANLSYGTVFYYLKGKSEITAINLGRLFDILNKLE